MFVSNVASKSTWNDDHNVAKPYCQCWTKGTGPVPWKRMYACTCGEEHNVTEWKWEEQDSARPSWVVISEDQKLVTFHPFYSSGTAVVRGDTALLPSNHYYWEVKMLTDTYGTDIMVGVGSNKVNLNGSKYVFTSLLGLDNESYGLSYKGVVHHNAVFTTKDTAGFCRGSIIGVRVDMWNGTLEFYINRIPQGCMLDDYDKVEKDVNPAVNFTRKVLSDVVPGEYTNGYYVDNVERDFRLVIWE